MNKVIELVRVSTEGQAADDRSPSGNFGDREQKRKLLAALVPDIRLADYRIESLGLDSDIFSNEQTRMDKDSWPRPA
jgi:hypothetical protein